ETDIILQLPSPPLGSDPQNHAVPILEVLRVPGYEGLDLLVIPFLRKRDDPPMETVREFVVFVPQNLRSSDCSGRHIMMDARDMYPGGFHSVKTDLAPDISGPARHYSRTQRTPTYYIIDFGISVR
ncbi:hypothetical protein M422DRAFT_82939, partial [Sphaerobolus stellatus SS14]